MPSSKKEHLKEFDNLLSEFKQAAKEVAGYPLAQTFDYSKLFAFLKFHINNLGDPFLESWNYRINSLKVEKKVIDYFAQLFHAPKNDYWGYVTNGGTEGNLYGLYVGRELYPEAVVYYSDQTHYSIPKNLRLLRMPSVKVKALSNGEIDYQDLRNHLIVENKSSKRVPIIMANIGTTMKGAIDDITQIKAIFSDLKIKNYYIHCDAAFFGMTLPFLSETVTQAFDFRAGIDSIAISGHKLIGTPFPCGVVLTKKNLNQIAPHIEYTRAKDNTIAGSRNGLSPLFLWHALCCNEKEKFQELVNSLMEKAEYAIKKFNQVGIKAWRNENSNIVVFPKPPERVIKKWQLAVEGDIAHLVILQHISHSMIDQIVSETVTPLKETKKARKKLPLLEQSSVLNL